jgi:DNA-binding NtrC family response regulator
LSSQKILIVDDDVAVSTVVKMTLEDKYDIASTTSAKSALKYLSEYSVDLILLDIKMPNMNGIDALEEIKKRHPEIIVVMLTGYASDENIEKGKTLGAHGFISKPFDVQELRIYIDSVLN